MRLAIIVALTLTGCSVAERTWEPTILRSCETEAERTALQAWILECIERANPKSDEEPEDWMPTCEAIGRRAICVTEIAAVQKLVGGRITRSLVDCRLAVNPDAKAACKGGE